MNKKSFLALSFAAIAIVSGYAGVKAFRSQACCENDLLAQNIEALSESEGGSSDSWDCWSALKEGSGAWKCGNPCEYEDYKSPDQGPGKCHK